MYPLLQDRDKIFFKEISLSEARVNDVLLVEKQKKLFIHRAIYKAQKYLITKGDNNLKSDGKIYPKQIIAKAIKIKREGQEFDLEHLYLIQSTFYLQEIIKLKSAFNQAKLNYLFLKGLPLHFYLEKTHPRRIYCDCDVLITKKDFKRVKGILEKKGYVAIDASLSSIHNKLRTKEIEVDYIKRINEFKVVFDLHLEIDWQSRQLGNLNSLYPQKLLDQLTKDFLRTKRAITVQGGSYEILNTEYLILYLTLHFFHHNYRGAFRLDFIDKVIRKSKLTNKQWEQLAMKIHEYHLRNYTYASFCLLKRLYKTPIPTGFLTSIKPSKKVMKYLGFIIQNPTSIFDDQSRIRAGVERFKLIFVLSPSSWYGKLLVFTKPIVIYTVIWVFLRRIKKMISF